MRPQGSDVLFLFPTPQGFHANKQERVRGREVVVPFFFFQVHHKEYSMNGPLNPTEIILIAVMLICLLICGSILFWSRGGDGYTRDTTSSYNSRGWRDPHQ